MHDIRMIRENPAAFDASLARRGSDPQSAVLLALDEKRRVVIASMQALQTRRNEASKAIGQAKARKDDVTATVLMDEVADLKARLPALEDEERAIAAQWDAAAAAIPNLPADDVPDGPDESANVVIAETGNLPQFAFEPREHDVIGPSLGLDFEAGVAIAGTRFALLRGRIAQLHRALGQFMLERLVDDHGYEEVAPPLLVRGDALFGTGQLPKFADDLFRTTDDRWLIPTAEVSLTNIVRGAILSEDELPLRFAALTPCFRSEAGAAGRDTKGLIRQHQFDKVEMVSVTAADRSDEEHERMTRCAEGALEALGLPYRRMLLCTGDMGFSAARTYDLEVWLPGQKRYREISSCSNCTDFQARRMNARYRPDGKKTTRFVHSLNGSALAVGRTLVAVLESYQQADGSITVPEVLRTRMGGLETLEPQS